jgi:hypothetical protein
MKACLARETHHREQRADEPQTLWIGPSQHSRDGGLLRRPRAKRLPTEVGNVVIVANRRWAS